MITLITVSALTTSNQCGMPPISSSKWESADMRSLKTTNKTGIDNSSSIKTFFHTKYLLSSTPDFTILPSVPANLKLYLNASIRRVNIYEIKIGLFHGMLF
jgi:hypothetical protein